MARPIYTIAQEIERDWRPVNPHAWPYLAALLNLEKMSDMYGADDAESIILYFLNNAGSWRGPKAVEIKKELKQMLKQNRRGSMDRQTAEIVATLTMEGHTDKAQEILAAEGVEITAVGKGRKRGPAKELEDMIINAVQEYYEDAVDVNYPEVRRFLRQIATQINEFCEENSTLYPGGRDFHFGGPRPHGKKGGR